MQRGRRQRQIEQGARVRKTSRKLSFAKVPRDYRALVAMFPPRPIHDTADYSNTPEIVLVMAEHFKVRADYFL